jgi:uridine kinase
MNIQLPFQVVAARVNYKVESLNFLVYKPKDIEFIDASSSSGMRVYERSLCMVLAKAVEDLYPGAILRIEHPISNGDYCDIDIFEGNISEEHVTALRKRMHEIIAEDLPIVEEEKQTSIVTKLFRERNQTDKVFLLETLGIPYTRYFRIGDFVDYYNSVLVPSTGYLKVFELQSFYGGLLLQMPSKLNPGELMKYVPQPKLFEVFKEYLQWNKIMGLSNVGDFNVMARTRNIYHLIIKMLDQLLFLLLELL